MSSINEIMERTQIKKDIYYHLIEFDKRCSIDPMYKRGLYIYGRSGAGTSHFIKEILIEMNFDIIEFLNTIVK